MKIQSIRGMNDLLPEHSATWQYVEATLSRLLASYSYKEIRFPILEKTDLFKRAVGEVTDICLLYTSPSPRDRTRSRMPSSA